MRKINFNEPTLFNNEISNIKKVFLRKSFTGNKFYTKKVTETLTKLFNNKYTLLTDSNSSAMEIIADCIDLKPNDHILIPSYEYPTTASAFLKRGAKIKFLDLDPKNFMICKKDILKKISKKTKAVILLHYGGHSDDIKFYLNLRRKYKFFLIEDAAQTIGTKYKNKHLGTYGDFGTISFHETKNIHCGLGGALIINNKKFVNKATYIWERGTDRKDFKIKKKYTWVENGGNHYPSEFQSAFLDKQVQNLNKVIIKRKKVFREYYNFFSKEKFNRLFYTIKNKKTSNYHMFYLVFFSKKVKESYLKFMHKNRVSCQTHYEPLHSSKMGRKINKKLKLKNVETYYNKIVRLPLHQNLSKKDLLYIKSTSDKFFNKYF